LIPIFLTIDISFTFLVYRRNPNEIPAAEQTQTYQLPPPGLVAEVEVDLPTIDPREVKPKIDSVEVTQLGDDAQVKITGERFRGSKVVFRQGDDEFPVTPSGSSDTQFTVTVPRQVILGVMDVVVEHPRYGTSNAARLKPHGGLGAVAPTGQGATFFSTQTN